MLIIITQQSYFECWHVGHSEISVGELLPLEVGAINVSVTCQNTIKSSRNYNDITWLIFPRTQ